MECRSFETVAITQSSEETKMCARMLALCAEPGDVVLLTGDLGAGKTQFAQGFAAGLGSVDQVISPTFNIVITYGSGRLALHHFDLYRLENALQLEDIGLREYLESSGVCLVEWAEKFPEAFDEGLSVRIGKDGESSRRIEASARGERAGRLLEEWLRMLEGEADGSTTGQGSATSAEGITAQPVATGSAGCTAARTAGPHSRFVLAFDTANEVVAVGIGELDPRTKSVVPVATRELAAHRASNTTLVPLLDEMFGELGISRNQIGCVCVGRGPGSFTGVRIAMATAKGISQALGVALVGVSTLDAIAFNVQLSGVRGRVLVVADAMRKEVYPVRYLLDDDGITRLEADRVIKADEFAREAMGSAPADEAPGVNAELEGSARGIRALDENESTVLVTGDALAKYGELFEKLGAVLPEELWAVTGSGLLRTLEAQWRAGAVDPFDEVRHDPAYALPVYTRLSDAEENERKRLSLANARNLETGVQDVASDGRSGRATMHAESRLVAPPDDAGVVYRPLDKGHVADIAAMEGKVMGSDAWSERLVASELDQRNRSWWIAEVDGKIAGYAGGLVAGGEVELLKVATDEEFRRHGIARELVSRVVEDARNLGAGTCTLEVRESNSGAQAFYASLGLETAGVRPRYYSDGEDAVIMNGPLPAPVHDVAGMELQHHERAEARESTAKHPIILAIESSCDETAAAVVDGEGNLLSDIVASQIDFHARFGGVVPEIASRKHIEAICGVCEEALSVARAHDGMKLTWADIDSVAVTYAPGLLGALVVGVAYAKGAAWARDVPLIGVNHLEGHLYANKIGAEDFRPPAIVSLVSGGNTMLVHMRDWGDYETLGSTIDDAVGEAFDKVAKALGLGYPGGPVISRYAAEGDPDAIPFPRAMMHSHDLRFSLSGLKTAVVTYINSEREAGRELNIADIAASFQQAVIDVQVAKARTALRQTGAKTFCLGGGVAANPALRSAYEEMCAKEGVELVMPPLASCGDNAGMIALVALDRYRARKFFDLSVDALAHANLDEPY